MELFPLVVYYFRLASFLGNCSLMKKKVVELVGFEPTAFRMQSGRATTALKPHLNISCLFLDVELYKYSIFVLCSRGVPVDS